MGSPAARVTKLTQAPEQFLRDSRSLALRWLGSAATRAIRGRQTESD